MKILITGSNGLLGQKLVALLRQQAGVAIIATSRGANKLARLYPDLSYATLDVTDRGLKLVELAPGVAVEEMVRKTGAPVDTSALR